MTVQNKTFANFAVLDFYKTLPFNYYGSIDKQADSVVNGLSNIETNVPLVPLLRKAKSVLDVGCGAGWLTNTIAYNFNCEITGIDFNPIAVERAQAVARHLKLRSQILTQDLFTYSPRKKFDLVVSMGVLHHTDNCIEAVRYLYRSVLSKGGAMYIGLYHTYGRAPFLQYFEEMKQARMDEEYLFQKYRELHSYLSDDQHLRSWFRDQVLHPHETQHTLREIAMLVKQEGGRLTSTSINRFEPFDDVEELFALEQSYDRLGRDALEKRRYFPGFFTVLVEKS